MNSNRRALAEGVAAAVCGYVLATILERRAGLDDQRGDSPLRRRAVPPTANDVDEKEERLTVLHHLLERGRAMIVKVRSGLVDAAELRNVEAVEHLISSDRLERPHVGEHGAGIARLEHDARPIRQVDREPLSREIKARTLDEARRKPFGGGFETTMLIETGFVEPSNDGKMRFSRFCTCAGPPWHRPQKLSNFSFPLPLELRERRVDVRQGTAGVDRRRELPRLRGREDVPLEFRHALEEVLGRRSRRFHVLVDGTERLRLQRFGRTVLLIRRGVLQHVQRCHGAGERHFVAVGSSGRRTRDGSATRTLTRARVLRRVKSS
jgi:hypothetical protein